MLKSFTPKLQSDGSAWFQCIGGSCALAALSSGALSSPFFLYFFLSLFQPGQLPGVMPFNAFPATVRESPLTIIQVRILYLSLEQLLTVGFLRCLQASASRYRYSYRVMNGSRETRVNGD